MFIGFGTVVNVLAILAGSAIGLLLGGRLPDRTRDTVTDAIGLVTLLIGVLSAFDVTEAAFTGLVGSSAPVLIVLGSLLIGGIVGSLLDIERQLEALGGWLRNRLLPRGRTSGDGGSPTDDPASVVDDPASTADDPASVSAGHRSPRERFIEGFVTTSLIFCIGPLTILGSLSDGLGRGADQLILKSVLDGFTSIAFAASLGVGVLASTLVVAIVQGSLTLVGFLIGDFLPEAHLLSLTSTGGVILLGLGLRLLNIRQIPVGNLLPALIVAPLLTELVAVLG